MRLIAYNVDRLTTLYKLLTLGFQQSFNFLVYTKQIKILTYKEEICKRKLFKIQNEKLKTVMIHLSFIAHADNIHLCAFLFRSFRFNRFNEIKVFS